MDTDDIKDSFFLFVMCTVKIHLAQLRVLVRWPGFNLQIKIHPCFLIYFSYLLTFFFFQDNKLALGNKATREKGCGRNPSAVQPIQMFQEQLSASAGAEQRAQHRQADSTAWMDPGWPAKLREQVVLGTSAAFY